MSSTSTHDKTIPTTSTEEKPVVSVPRWVLLLAHTDSKLSVDFGTNFYLKSLADKQGFKREIKHDVLPFHQASALANGMSKYLKAASYKDLRVGITANVYIRDRIDLPKQVSQLRDSSTGKTTTSLEVQLQGITERLAQLIVSFIFGGFSALQRVTITRYDVDFESPVGFIELLKELHRKKRRSRHMVSIVVYACRTFEELGNSLRQPEDSPGGLEEDISGQLVVFNRDLELEPLPVWISYISDFNERKA
ncbi:hypothetical protein DXG01_004418 [Tephrocybe rancida]|nr:hypothetical protein DXG01_004418 [Tephrocybe rancida]